MPTHRISCIGIIASIVALSAAASVEGQPSEKATASPAGGYRVVKTFNAGGEGGWDYLAVDAPARRLYVTRGTHVMVLDADTGKSVGDIKDTPGVHGVALAADAGRGFTSNGRAGSATIFDLKTLKILGSVKTGENPDAIVYEPVTQRVFTMNGRSHDSTAIDAAAGTAVGKIELGGKPEFAVADGSGKLFINIEDKNEVVAVDAKALKVTARWPLSPGEEPSGLAIDVKNRRLFSVCGNKKMIVLDADTGKVLATLPIGDRVDGAAFDPATGFAYSSNGDGTLTIVHEDDSKTFSVVQNVVTPRGARTIALDPKTHHVYLPSAKYEAASATATERPRQRPAMIPGSFAVIVVGK